MWCRTNVCQSKPQRGAESRAYIHVASRPSTICRCAQRPARLSSKCECRVARAGSQPDYYGNSGCLSSRTIWRSRRRSFVCPGIGLLFGWSLPNPTGEKEKKRVFYRFQLGWALAIENDTNLVHVLIKHE